MKRIAVLAALMFGLLAIPTAAMASTGSSGGSGSGHGTTVSLQPGTCYYGFHRVHRHYQKYFEWWRHGREYRTVTCPFPRQIRLPQPQPQPLPCLTFSVAAGSSVLTEVSGPQLYPGEKFVYDGNTYTIKTVNPGAGQFTASVNGSLFTNEGAAITNTVVCPLPRQIPPPQPQPQRCLSPQTLTFSVAADSSVMTEVSGPELSPTEQFVYDGNTYTVMSVNPGANQFTAFVNNFLFTNHGAAITDATGALVCSSS